MKISKQALEKLKSFEGCKLFPYKAVSSEKYYTVGFGHYGPDVVPGKAITQEEADRLLVEDLQKFEDHVNKHFKSVGLNQHQFDALVDFSFNCGFRTSSTLYKKILANKNDKSIKDAFMMWNKSGGKELAGLTKRRKWEGDWYFAETPTEEIEDLSSNSDSEESSNNSSNASDVVSNTINNSNGGSDGAKNAFQFTDNSSHSEKTPPKILRSIKPTIIVDTLGAS